MVTCVWDCVGHAEGTIIPPVGWAGPGRTKPSRAEPGRAKLARVELGRAEPSRAEPGRAQPSPGQTWPKLCFLMCWILKHLWSPP